MADFDPASTGLVPQPPQPRQHTPARQLAPNVHETGFDDDSVRKYDFDLYSGRLNETDRIYLLRPRGLVKARVHFHDKLKYVRCNSTFKQTGNQEVLQSEAQCCKSLGKSSLRFGAVILRYVTDRAGNLIKPFQPPELRLWKFSVDKYLILKGINNDFLLEEHDLSVTCTEVQYQKMVIGAKPKDQCIYTMKNFPADLKAQIENWVQASLPKLPNEMGRQMSDADILKELGQAMAAAPQMTQADQPIAANVFDDLVGVGGAPSAGQ